MRNFLIFATSPFMFKTYTLTHNIPIEKCKYIESLDELRTVYTVDSIVFFTEKWTGITGIIDIIEFLKEQKALIVTPVLFDNLTVPSQKKKDPIENGIYLLKLSILTEAIESIYYLLNKGNTYDIIKRIAEDAIRLVHTDIDEATQ